MLGIKQSYMEDKLLLASVALFRKLYDNRKDSYDVLSDFIRASINIKKIWSFTVDDCVNALKESFGFKIPAAVVKTCLRRRLKDEVNFFDGKISVTEKFHRQVSLSDEITSAQNEQQRILDDLTEFYLTKKGGNSKDINLQKLREDFHHYFLGDLENGESQNIINQFIVEKSKDQCFVEKLNHLEEGLILYQGIGYSPDNNNNNLWSSDFTIYLDTEVLFWANGYDGILFKRIFDDFIELIKEINSKKSVNIQIKYFQETTHEIDGFFNYAEKNINSNRIFDPKRTAMQHLLNGCSTASDVLEKKVIFYSTLRNYRISEEVEQNYYKNPEFNLESAQAISELIKSFPDAEEDKIATALKIFTRINCLRKGNSNIRLEDSKAILVSGKNLYRNIAFHSTILQTDKAIPYSTSIEYITERLWFRLGKGFGENKKTPATFDVVSRAQVILSSQISSKISGDYKILLKKMQHGEISANDARYLISELKTKSLKPEELTPETIEDISLFLDEKSIEASIRQIRLLEQDSVNLSKTQRDLDDAKNQVTEKTKDLENKDRKLNEYKKKTYDLEVINWRNKLSTVKKESKALYILSIIISFAALLYLCYFSAMKFKSQSDSNLSILSAIITFAAFILCFISYKKIINAALKISKKWLRINIRRYGKKPKWKAALNNINE